MLANTGGDDTRTSGADTLTKSANIDQTSLIIKNLSCN